MYTSRIPEDQFRDSRLGRKVEQVCTLDPLGRMEGERRDVDPPAVLAALLMRSSVCPRLSTVFSSTSTLPEIITRRKHPWKSWNDCLLLRSASEDYL